jgi:hypothetical protein
LAAESIHALTHDLVVLIEEVAPPPIPDLGGQVCRSNDVGEKDGRVTLAGTGS